MIALIVTIIFLFIAATLLDNWITRKLKEELKLETPSSFFKTVTWFSALGMILSVICIFQLVLEWLLLLLA